MFLKALAAGFGIVIAGCLYAGLVFAAFQGPNVKATAMWILLLSPYYWILMIMLVALVAHAASSELTKNV
jgi:hypothetical protein